MGNPSTAEERNKRLVRYEDITVSDYPHVKLWTESGERSGNMYALECVLYVRIYATGYEQMYAISDCIGRVISEMDIHRASFQNVFVPIKGIHGWQDMYKFLVWA